MAYNPNQPPYNPNQPPYNPNQPPPYNPNQPPYYNPNQPPPYNPNQPMYNPNQPASYMTPQPQKKGNSIMGCLGPLLILILIGGGFFGYQQWQKQQSEQAKQQYPFSNDLKLNSALSSVDEDWATFTEEGDGCEFTNGAYHVIASDGYVIVCTQTEHFNDFTYEATTSNFQGAGQSAFGLLFASSGGIGKQEGTVTSGFGFMISADNKWIYAEYDRPLVEVPGEETDLLKPLKSGPLPSGINPKEKNTLSVIANGKTLRFMINGKPVGEQITGDDDWSGRLGVIAVGENGKAAVDYNDAKGWEHDGTIKVP